MCDEFKTKAHVSFISQVLRVQAIDGDRDVNSQIVYSIVPGSAAADRYFAINPDTGIVFTTAELDREEIQDSAGAVVLHIQAREASEPQLASTTEVTIIVEVCENEARK